jgi:predicted nucleic acid-binding protein
MVIVDTSVWIDFFRGKDTAEIGVLDQFLTTGEDICICGIILTEVFQGIRKDQDYSRTLSRFDTFLFLDMNRRTFVKAARIYRTLRHRGITISKIVDCMIAAAAIEHRISLLHNDRDFDPIEKYHGLKVVKVA